MSSSFDVRAAPGIKVPAGYADYFKSVDGKQRTMVAEATGGPTWYTEFNVVTGLSARSFGDLKFYVTRIAAGRVTRGLPAAAAALRLQDRLALSDLRRLPRRPHLPEGAGVEQFIDMAEMGVNEDMQPDSFYFDQALKVFAREAAVARAASSCSCTSRPTISLDRCLPARADAGLDAARQHRRDRRISSAARP